MADLRETSFEYTDGDKYATVSSSETKWINKIVKMHEQYPDDIEIVCSADDNYGMIMAHVPKSWLKISPPKKINLTDEQKAAMKEQIICLNSFPSFSSFAQTLNDMFTIMSFISLSVYRRNCI